MSKTFQTYCHIQNARLVIGMISLEISRINWNGSRINRSGGEPSNKLLRSSAAASIYGIRECPIFDVTWMRDYSKDISKDISDFAGINKLFNKFCQVRGIAMNQERRASIIEKLLFLLLNISMLLRCIKELQAQRASLH